MSDKNPEPIVKLEAASKYFGRTAAVKDIDFSLEPGISYGLIGRNGAGKSTLLRLIAGLLRPTRGRVLLFGGDPIADAEKVKVHLGYLAEDQAYPGSLRPADLFRFLEDCYPTWDRKLLYSLVDRFRIPLGKRLDRLSKGQARQVGLLCAVAHRPKLLLLDEPGGGLDVVARRAFLEEVIELLASGRSAVLFSSHNLQEVERIASRIGIIHEGRLILEESADRLREGACQALVDADVLDGENLKSRLPGCLGAARRDGGWLITIRAGEAEARGLISEHLGGRVLDARPVTLEELFIAMTGEAA